MGFDYISVLCVCVSHMYTNTKTETKVNIPFYKFIRIILMFVFGTTLNCVAKCVFAEGWEVRETIPIAKLCVGKRPVYPTHQNQIRVSMPFLWDSYMYRIPCWRNQYACYALLSQIQKKDTKNIYPETCVIDA